MHEDERLEVFVLGRQFEHEVVIAEDGRAAAIRMREDRRVGFARAADAGLRVERVELGLRDCGAEGDHLIDGAAMCPENTFISEAAAFVKRSRPTCQGGFVHAVIGDVLNCATSGWVSTVLSATAAGGPRLTLDSGAGCRERRG